MGDIFKDPYMLQGVEWTLRIEISFYAFMFCMRSAGLLSTYQRFFPGVLVLLTFLLGMLKGFPDGSYGCYGYWNMYAPFLLLSSAFLLYEKKSAGSTFLVFFAGFVLIQCWQLTMLYSPGMKDFHFVSLGFLVFLTAWLFRNYMHMNRLCLLISELTYSVYLFHNWLFDQIKTVPLFNSNLKALIVLILFCIAMNRVIEKPGIRLGKSVCRWLEERKRTSVVNGQIS